MPLDLKMTQFFGEKQPVDQICEEDIISVISFDNKGKYFCLGDKAGRVIIFEKPETKKGKTYEYGYLTELQSHLREFDFLKSNDIDEKINCIEWLDSNSNVLFLLSTNDKTIKLWKISDKCIKKSSKTNKKVVNDGDLQMPKLREIESGFTPMLKNTFPNLHEFNINSLNILSNKEQMVSSDDLKVNLWDLNRIDQNIYTIFDIKPNAMEEITEVITSTKAHPLNDNICSLSSSKGFIRLLDMRVKSNNDNNALLFEDKLNNQKKNFFSEIINSISEVNFSNNGNYMFSRDFLNVKIWDVKMNKEPVKVIPVFEPIKTKLCEMYESETIFDKFSISSSPCSNYILTGSYDNKFHIIDREGKKNIQYETNYKKKTITKDIPSGYNEKLGTNFEVDRKILKSTWCKTTNTILAVSLNCVFIYQAL